MKTPFPSDDKFSLIDQLRVAILQAQMDDQFVCGLSIPLESLRMMFDVISPGVSIDVSNVRIMGYPVFYTEANGPSDVVIDMPDFPAYRAIYDYCMVTGKMPKVVYENCDVVRYGDIADIAIRSTDALPLGKAVCA